MDDDMRGRTNEDRLEDMPEHESDEDVETVGGGVMSAGGTAVDRGTGTLGGTAQGPRDADDHDDLDDDFDAAPVDPGRIEAPGIGVNPNITPRR
ncbi:MAG TPA: hypothetical protein VLA44_09730 [Clostridia bacterium]|nr:hypothetical protein [Clostridia bacterium]